MAVPYCNIGRLVAVVTCLAVFVDSRAVDHDRDISPLLTSEILNLMNLHMTRWREPQDLDVVDTPLVRPPHPRLIPDWPRHGFPPLGQVAGVSVTQTGHLVVFHRGGRVFDSKSFNNTHHFQYVDEGPIPEDTVLFLDPNNGDVVLGLGRDTFYMPHSITVDNRDNIWVTDGALHQVLKFSNLRNEPTMVLGKRFTPGPGNDELCMPTDVAVATTGEIFVADGYCNSRLLKFDQNGNLLRKYPQNQEVLQLQIPHSIALLERLDLLCTADRENQRVVCVSAELRAEGPTGTSVVIEHPDLGRVFGIAAYGDFLYAVNGYTSDAIPIRGFTMDPESATIIDRWAPPRLFENPHSLAVSSCASGQSLYVAEIGPNRVWKFDLPQPQAM